MKLILATRRSHLALAQSRWIRGRLIERHPDLTVELAEYVTQGDRIQDVALSEIGSKGLFTREIEEALLNTTADLAVHSLKDLPSEMPEGLCLLGQPGREDPRDALVLRSRDHVEVDPSLACLPSGARVGTSSLRRQAQLLTLRPDLTVRTVRGNVDTRLRKLDQGDFDALVLAAAGLKRLGLQDRISAALPPEWFVPAPGQGALGLQCRSNDEQTRRLVAPLEDRTVTSAVRAERAVLAALGGGCSVPLGAHAEVTCTVLRVSAALAAIDGSRVIRATLSGPIDDPDGLGRDVAEGLLTSGGRELLGR